MLISQRSRLLARPSSRPSSAAASPPAPLSTADVGWMTGHSYVVYGPLANGATTLMFEGMPTYPDSSRFWQVRPAGGGSQ